MSKQQPSNSAAHLIMLSGFVLSIINGFLEKDSDVLSIITIVLFAVGLFLYIKLGIIFPKK